MQTDRERDASMEDTPSSTIGTERTRGLKDSRHTALDRTEEELEKITGELIEGQEQYGRKEGEPREKEGEMEVDEEGKGMKNRSWGPIWDSREAITIVWSIKTNGEVLEEINALRPKERSWKTAKDASVARDLIKAGGGCIEGG
ncbi:hypothetical protein L211DRAFT_893954 [Terfezia boudieri ATCC MYA-4762]|uniref:Uncharacterized protein n=1 Tax=Terfezia boudieri ATCC MYA-4762 TaxID=1051890 RepID=A0A3N4M030_9PEZI|nr:hypothetical protein L211DRAFT_893954 [Terfezia boudieri ATCC MYA-4762]